MTRLIRTIYALTALLVFFDASLVLGGQVPIVDGIIGGVPSALKPAVRHQGLTSAATTPGKLRVTENSGVCETTPGVYQASGYGDLSASESLWFWFFAARKNTDTAPLAIWLNGGPGSSSMIGLLQENGPCRIKNDSSDVDFNPYSWNEVANMLYIDQPVGVGFSHGSQTVGTSQQAAEDTWKFLQIFFSDPKFAKYAKNDFAVWTESYGGHYGPVFSAYFLQQNAAIAKGSISGIPINLKVLGIGDGLTDPIAQYPSYLSYAASNNYHPLVESDVLTSANNTFYRPFGCLDRMTDCSTSSGDPDTCSLAQVICNELILEPLAGEYDVYDVRATSPDPYPPDISGYLSSSSLMTKIGAESAWQQSNDVVYGNFAGAGDWMISALPQLEAVIDSGVRTVIYVGDADFIVNYKGIEAMTAVLQTKSAKAFAEESFANWTVAGQITGVYKNADTFSYVRVFGSGHEVPAYKFGNLETGQAALAMFSQIMQNKSISST